jgi:hypothetical protein
MPHDEITARLRALITDATATRRQKMWARRALEAIRSSSEDRRLLTVTSAFQESRLVRWLRYQRVIEESLSDFQAEVLESLPGWSWDPRQDAWDVRADQLERFLSDTGRWPSTRSTHRNERGLGHWVARQRRATQKGTIGYVRQMQWQQKFADK